MARMSRLYLKDELYDVVEEALDELSEEEEVSDDEEVQHITDRIFEFLSEHDSSELSERSEEGAEF